MKGRIFGIYSKSGSLRQDRLLKARKFVKKSKLEITDEFSDNFCQLAFAQHTEKINEDNSSIFLYDGFINNEKNFLNVINSIEDLEYFPQKQSIKLEDHINEISGEYALVNYNKAFNTLCISRDVFGTRPLYIFNKDDEIIFSSEIKFITKILNKELMINEEKMISFLTQFRKNTTDTFFKDIESYEPGLITIYHKKSEKIYKKSLAFKKFEGSFEEAKEKLKKVLAKSVQETIDRPNKTAILVSGGIDSASVLKNVNKKSRKEIKTFSMNFFDNDGKTISCDETEFQNKLVKEYAHKSIEFYDQSPFEQVDYWLERYDQPFLLPNAYLYEKAYETLKKEDIHFIADGNGGDSVFSHGWERFSELFDSFQLFKYFSEIKKFSKLHNYDEYTKSNLTRKFTAGLLRRNYYLDIIMKFINKILNRKNNRKLIIKTKFLKGINFKDIYNFSGNFKPHEDKIFNPIAESAFSALDILFFNYGIEQRSPLFNNELVKLMVSFPSEYKLKDGKARYILREAMTSIIPEEILNRYSKSNLSENFKKGINNKDLKNIAEEIDTPHEILEKYIDKEILDFDFTKFSNSRSGATSMNIWNYYLVNRWLKKNFT